MGGHPWLGTLWSLSKGLRGFQDHVTNDLFSAPLSVLSVLEKLLISGLLWKASPGSALSYF